jgi:uncharacterized OsmC-like protein
LDFDQTPMMGLLLFNQSRTAKRRTTGRQKMSRTEQTTMNGLDPIALQSLIDSVSDDPRNGLTHWQVSTQWKGGTVSQANVSGYEIGGRRVDKNFELLIDEPLELGGTNSAANPQEVLLSAMNACMTVGYVAVATLMGITLESLEIDTEGDIDLRGFLGLDPDVKPGYDSLSYTVRIKGDASEADFQKLHETVIATSPNRFNIASPIALSSQLIVE